MGRTDCEGKAEPLWTVLEYMLHQTRVRSHPDKLTLEKIQRLGHRQPEARET